jgi:hypothetical protein
VTTISVSSVYDQDPPEVTSVTVGSKAVNGSITVIAHVVDLQAGLKRFSGIIFQGNNATKYFNVTWTLINGSICKN